jgi:hypothetical protein
MLSRAEFASLDRYSNGRLMDLPNVFHLLTDAQVEELHSDDWSYYQELVEEIEYEYARELNYERQFDIDNAQEMRYDNDDAILHDIVF